MNPRHGKPIDDPQDLEPALIARASGGDVEGMAALYASDAVVAMGRGEFARGTAEIRHWLGQLLATGFVFHAGEQFPAVVSGELALTSSRYPNGTVSAEVARRQEDGTWLWVLDYPTIGE